MVEKTISVGRKWPMVIIALMFFAALSVLRNDLFALSSQTNNSDNIQTGQTFRKPVASEIEVIKPPMVPQTQAVKPEVPQEPEEKVETL